MSFLPIAHFGHYLWTLYVAPFVVVVFAIVRSALEQRRESRKRDDGEDGKGSPGAS